MNQRRLHLPAFLPFRLSVLSNAISQRIAADYEDRFGISVAQWRVIAILGSEGEATAKQISGIAVMDKVAISRAVNALVQRGLAERRVSREDARALPIRLTKEGERIHRTIAAIALDWEDRLLEALDERDRADLDRIIARLHGAMDEEDMRR